MSTTRNTATGHPRPLRKRMSLRLPLALSLLLLLCSVMPGRAQQLTGEWNIFPAVGHDYDLVTETAGKVYFLSSGSMYSVDKTTGETYHYNSANSLSGHEVKHIYTNPAAGYVIAVYDDYNMDLIRDDGRVYCLPEIKDTSAADPKTINDIAFGEGRIVVATAFGIVIYDDKRLEVVESGIYKKSIDNAGVCGSNIVIYHPYSVLYSPVNARHNTLESFTQIGGMYTRDFLATGDNSYVWVNANNGILTTTKVDFSLPRVFNTVTDYTVDTPLCRWKDGFYFRSGDDILLFDSSAALTGRVTLPEVLRRCRLSLYDGPARVWAAGPDGSACYDLSGPEPVVRSGWYRPEAVTCSRVAWLTPSPDGRRIYVSNFGPSNLKTYMQHYATDPDGVKLRQTTDIIEEGHIRDISLIEASATMAKTAAAQEAAGNKAMYGGVTRLAEDPSDPSTYYIGNGIEGLYVVSDRKEVWKFDKSNSPLTSYWGTRVLDVNFDPAGNLWVGYSHNEDDLPPYLMLPAAKLRKGFDRITASDWQQPSLLDLNPFIKDFVSLFCKRSRYAFFINGTWRGGLYVLDTKGTYETLRDDTCYKFPTLTDQDGNSIEVDLYYSLAEDRLGRVWLGTNAGIFYINTAGGITEASNVIRPKVPRNDGTNFADYLLDSDQINAIAVDHSDRKWIATDFSGVYLVSENGDRIIEHFDTSNSPLPSNRVTAVAVDNNDNTVYFGTTRGLLSYKSDSSPAREDYGDVYAYPNPVRPDYRGPVTITGLMDGTLVKIADSMGNVIHSMRSEGGMATWDCCNRSGERVASGVYHVFLSSGTEGMSVNGAVTKIMVIN